MSNLKIGDSIRFQIPIFKRAGLDCFHGHMGYIIGLNKGSFDCPISVYHPTVDWSISETNWPEVYLKKTCIKKIVPNND